MKPLHSLTQDGPIQGYVQLHRSEQTLELLSRYPNAFLLLTLIAIRARRTASAIAGLAPNEAMIGDHKAAGLSQREYRTAKQVLAKLNFSTFKTTNKGTIAKLIRTSIFDVNVESSDKQADTQATSKRQLTRKIKCKNSEKEEKRPSLDVLRAYISEKGYNVNPEKWLAHYEANGWRVGRNSMKDWRACVRSWHHGNFGNGSSRPSSLNIGAPRPDPEPARELTPEEERAERIADLRDSITKALTFLSKPAAQADKNACRIVQGNLERFTMELAKIEGREAAG